MLVCVCMCKPKLEKREKCYSLLKEKKKTVSFYWTYVCVRAKLTFVSFLDALASLDFTLVLSVSQPVSRSFKFEMSACHHC